METTLEWTVAKRFMNEEEEVEEQKMTERTAPPITSFCHNF